MGGTHDGPGHVTIDLKVVTPAASVTIAHGGVVYSSMASLGGTENTFLGAKAIATEMVYCGVDSSSSWRNGYSAVEAKGPIYTPRKLYTAASLPWRGDSMYSGAQIM